MLVQRPPSIHNVNRDHGTEEQVEPAEDRCRAGAPGMKWIRFNLWARRHLARHHDGLIERLV